MPGYEVSNSILLQHIAAVLSQGCLNADTSTLRNQPNFKLIEERTAPGSFLFQLTCQVHRVFHFLATMYCLCAVKSNERGHACAREFGHMMHGAHV